MLSDATRRRQYDAARPAQTFHAQSTGGGRMHPYAAQAAAEAAARGYDPNRAPDFTARRMYGIDEEVWIAHHYGGHARRSSMPGRYYGMNIVEERMEAEEERIRRCDSCTSVRLSASESVLIRSVCCVVLSV